MTETTHLDDLAARTSLFGTLASRLGAIDDAARTAQQGVDGNALGPTSGDPTAIDPILRGHVHALMICLIDRHGGDAAAALAALNESSELNADPAAETRITRAETSTRTRAESLGDGLPVTVTMPETEGGSHSESARKLPDESGVIGGRYRIVRHLARGNLGEVYVAKDLELDREVALKQIQKKHLHKPVMRNLFEEEARVTGGLDHPGIAPVFSLGRDAANQPYYAMRYIRGESLRDAIKRIYEANEKDRDPIKLDHERRGLLQRFVAACYTVAYAHSRGVVHRDIKPANIMLGEYGDTIVVDWGLAKPLGLVPEADPSSESPIPRSGTGSAHSTTPGVKGTPAFMSAEQARGEPVKPPGDIYSLGATLYAIITGKAPFSATSNDEVLAAVRAGNFPMPLQVRGDVPRALEAVCLKAMALKPEARFARAKDMAAEVERFLNDEPVLCDKEPLLDRAWRKARRHRVWVGIATTGLTLLAAASMPLAMMYLEKNAALRDRGAALVKAEQAKNKLHEQVTQTKIAQQHDSRHIRQLRKILGDDVLSHSERLAYVPHAEQMRVDLVNMVVGYYRQFLISRPNDKELKYEAANVFRTAANVYRLLELDPRATRRLYDEALANCDAATTNPSKRDRDRRAGRILIDRGDWLLQQGDVPGAQQDLDAAEDRLPQDGAAEGSDVDPRNDRQLEAILWGKQAELLAHQGDARALLKARDSERLFATSARNDRMRWIDQILHVQSLTLLARLERNAGQNVAAAATLDRAAAVIAPLVNENPKQLDYAETLASLLIERLDQSQPGSCYALDTHEALRAQTEVLSALQVEHPAVPVLRRAVARALLASARAYEATGETDAMESQATRALAYATPGSAVEAPLSFLDLKLAGAARILLAEASRRRGDPAGAGSMLDAAIADFQAALKQTKGYRPLQEALLQAEALKKTWTPE